MKTGSSRRIWVSKISRQWWESQATWLLTSSETQTNIYKVLKLQHIQSSQGVNAWLKSAPPSRRILRGSLLMSKSAKKWVHPPPIRRIRYFLQDIWHAMSFHDRLDAVSILVIKTSYAFTSLAHASGPSWARSNFKSLRLHARSGISNTWSVSYALYFLGLSHNSTCTILLTENHQIWSSYGHPIPTNSIWCTALLLNSCQILCSLELMPQV